jgi:DNA-binding PadR family transcriptional regulator
MNHRAVSGGPHLDMLVLAVLSQGPLHGYALIEGTVYPVLHRLEKAGLLSSDWSETAGRPRRTYSLTTPGRAALAEQRNAWHAISDAVGKVLGGGPWPAKI